MLNSAIEVETASSVTRRPEDTPPASRRQDAYETILHAIVFGDLAPDSRLDEKSLAQDFGLGIAGVRDALFRLALERLVIRQARIGTKVAGLDVRELQDVFEARILLECQCARIAAQRADVHDVAKLRDIAKEYEEINETRNFRELFRVDQAFHRTIARSTKNRFLEQQVVVLHNNASRFWYIGVSRLGEDELHGSLQSHVDVVNAIAERDSKTAETAMQACVGDFPAFSDYYISNREIYKPPE